MSRSEFLTGEELAEKMSVSPGTIRSWARRGMPVAQRGRRGDKRKPNRYRLEDVQAWRTESKRGTLDVNQARARRERAQAILAEQTVAIRARDLVPREQVEKAWAVEIMAVRTKLLSWPATISDKIYREATLKGLQGVQQVIKEAVDELLLELSTSKPKAKPRRVPKPKAGRRKK